MTRETKIGLLVGLSFIIVIGILLSEHAQSLIDRSIEFTSGEHTFTFGTEEVQVEGDAVRDPSGKVWRIDVPGEDTAELLRSWKTGRLDWKQ